MEDELNRAFTAITAAVLRLQSDEQAWELRKELIKAGVTVVKARNQLAREPKSKAA